MADVWEQDEENPELQIAQNEWSKNEDEMTKAGFRDGAGGDYKGSFEMGFAFGFKQGLQYGLHRGEIKGTSMAGGSQVMEEGAASREEELSKKKAFEEFKEQLQTYDMETLARMNEVEKETKVTVKNVFSQETTQADSKDQ